MKAEIISIGTEIMLGEITDTNASYLAGQLPLLGIDLYWVSQVGDDEARLLEVLKRAWQRSDLVLATGGLGPTGDDLTREVIARMMGEVPETDPALEARLRERFSRMGLEMPLSNLKQITIIPSAEAIPNEVGTAPGWWIEKDGRLLVAMPGPPRELQAMWEESIRPRLTGNSGEIILTRTIKTFGLTEGAVGEMVSPLLSEANPTLGIYAKPDGIHLRIAAKAGNRKEAEEVLAKSEARISSIMEGYVWGTDDDTLEAVTGRLMINKGLTLAVMEDYSGGWLSVSITELPESSRFFKGGLVACSDEAKISFGVDAGILSRYGPVSPETALAMAEAAMVSLKADIGISSTAIAETAERPMGMAYIGIADGRDSRVVGRPRRRQQVSSTAMFELRKILLAAQNNG